MPNAFNMICLSGVALAKTDRFAAWPGKGSLPPSYFLSFSPQSSLRSPLPLRLAPGALYLSSIIHFKI